MHVTETDLLTSEEVSRLTGWDRATINRWAKSGKLPVAFEPGTRTGARLFHRSFVESLPRKSAAASECSPPPQ